MAFHLLNFESFLILALFVLFSIYLKKNTLALLKVEDLNITMPPTQEDFNTFAKSLEKPKENIYGKRNKKDTTKKLPL